MSKKFLVLFNVASDYIPDVQHDTVESAVEYGSRNCDDQRTVGVYKLIKIIKTSVPPVEVTDVE